MGEEISKKLILMAPLSGKSGKPLEEESAEPSRVEDSMEVETSLTVNSEEWDSTRNEQETLGDTSMDSTLDESEQGARSCVAQRTRSHTEEMREKIEQTRKMNLSKLKEMYSELREEKDKSKMDTSWELVENGANDSLGLPA